MKRKNHFKKLIWTLVGFKPHLVRAKIITESRASALTQEQSKQYKLPFFVIILF
jgi:hypothetical protein